MSRKRIAFTGAAVALGVGALVIPVTANAGTESDLGTTCGLAGGASQWWATGKFAVSNTGDAAAKDWKLRFNVSEGHVTVSDPGTFDIEQQGTSVTVTPVHGRGDVPANGERTVTVGINPGGKSVPKISGCTVHGGDDTETPEDTTAPTAPQDHGSFVIDHQTIHVMWKGAVDSGSGVRKYELFQDGKLIKTPDRNITMTNMEKLKPATAYRFKVRAVDAAGNVSAFSNDITLKTHAAPGDDRERPTLPKKLIGEANGPNQTSLSWQAGKDDVAVTGYRVYRNGVKYQDVDGGATAAVVSGLQPATQYKFKVTAVDSAGKESDPTDEITVKTGSTGGDGEGGSAPSGFSASTSSKTDGSVKQHYLNLAWGVPQGRGQVTTYQIYLNGKLAQTFMWGSGDPVMPVPSGKATREVLVGSGQDTYKVKIRAQLGSGEWSGFSTEATVTIPG